MDPSDLLALASLPAAWALWRSLEQQPVRQAPSRLAYLALAAASLASLATSPPMREEVDRVVVYGGQFYVGMFYDSSDGVSAASSLDGFNWSGITDPDPAVQALLGEALSLPKQVCLERQPATCFRITGQEQVERSDDGGQNWTVDWKMPAERKLFLERYCTPMCWYPPDMTPRDLAVLESADGFTIVAVMGNQGVLTSQRTWADSRQDGSWQQAGVLSIKPIPLRATDLGVAAKVIAPEIVGSVLVGALAFLGLSVYAWNELLLRSGRRTFRERLEVVLPFGWSLLILIAVLMMFVPLASVMSEAMMLLVLGVLMIIQVATSWISWGGVRRVSADKIAADQALDACWKAGLGVTAAGLLSMFLWAFGLPWYGLALGLALAAGAGLIVWGVLKIQRACAQIQPPEPPPDGEATALPVDEALQTPVSEQKATTGNQRIVIEQPWKFILVWVVANWVGLMAGSLVHQGLFALTGPSIAAVGTAGFYLVLGLAQWLGGTRRLGFDSRWIWFTALGALAGQWATSVLFISLPRLSSTLLGSPNRMLVLTAVFGLLIWLGIGIAQWLLLRAKFSRAGLWILAVAGASVVGDSIAYIVGLANVSMSATSPATFLRVLVDGLVLGLVTGVWLYAYLKKPVSEETIIQPGE